jgi:hypothetical protein
MSMRRCSTLPLQRGSSNSEKCSASFFADIRTCLQLSGKRETSPTSNRKLSPVFHALPLAWKAQTRLCTRYRSMVARGKKPTVVVAAIARELAGFIWAIGQQMRIAMAT